MKVVEAILFGLILLVHNLNCQKRQRISVDKKSKIFLNYLVEYKNKIVKFELENGMSKDNKWFAVGWSKNGKIKDADFCVVVSDHKRVFDAHPSQDGKVLVIDNQQDCKRRVIVDPKERDQNKIRFNRAFDTKDGHDKPFTQGTTHLHFIRGKKAVVVDGDVTLDLNVTKTVMTSGTIQLLKAGKN